jgi:hypothetical protein
MSSGEVLTLTSNKQRPYAAFMRALFPKKTKKNSRKRELHVLETRGRSQSHRRKALSRMK